MHKPYQSDKPHHSHLFVVRAARERRVPLPQPPSPHIAAFLPPINELVAQADVATAFDAPATLLVMQLAENDDYFADELRAHFPEVRRAPQGALGRGPGAAAPA